MCKKKYTMRVWLRGDSLLYIGNSRLNTKGNTRWCIRVIKLSMKSCLKNYHRHVRQFSHILYKPLSRLFVFNKTPFSVISVHFSL